MTLTTVTVSVTIIAYTVTFCITFLIPTVPFVVYIRNAPSFCISIVIQLYVTGIIILGSGHSIICKIATVRVRISATWIVRTFKAGNIPVRAGRRHTSEGGDQADEPEQGLSSHGRVTQ
ncbi:unnamed protein product [Meganyctiphanes norvegica]|uniref:Uncharacterized protein n=1 Tax=Meganyctiphanes norvegica TaxID=48144 RepID=A0AAV2QLJ3_MEGNR